MTAFAVSHDEARYVLNGILFIIKRGLLRLVATDGRRLALTEQQLDTAKNIQKQAIIPTKAITELNRALQDEGFAEVIISENQAMFKIDKVVIITRLIEGEFPNYEQVIPKKPMSKIRINTQRFLMGARRVGLLTHQDSQSIRLDFLRDRMIVSKNSPEIGEGKDEIELASPTDKELSIGFNPAYLMDALKNIDVDEIDFELNGPDKAGVIKAGEGYLYLILPMQLA